MPRLLVDVGPLRANRDFRFLYFGQVISLLGSNLTVVAVPFQVYRETHSSLWVGLASVLQLPFLVTGALWGGAMGDRGDKRRLMLACSSLLALLSAALALNARFDHGHLFVLVLLAAMSAGIAGFSAPLRSAAIPSLVGAQELVAAFSLNQLAFNVAVVVGPAIAGLLIAGVGLFSCYGVDAVTFTLLTVFTMFLTPMPATGRHRDTRILRSVAEGFRYVRGHVVTQAVYLVDLNAMVFGLPRALFPAVALTIYHGGPRTLGLLYAAPGAGAVVMAIATGWLARVQRQGRLVAMTVVAWGSAMTLFGLVHVAWFGLACLAFAGAMDVISTVLRNTIIQTAITDEFRSRISSIYLAVVTGGPRLGDLESGVVASLSSTEFSIVSGGVACVVGVVALMRWRPTFWNRVAP